MWLRKDRSFKSWIAVYLVHSDSNVIALDYANNKRTYSELFFNVEENYELFLDDDIIIDEED